MQRTKSKILSILLSLVMLLSLLPTTALAAAYYSVDVNGIELRDGYYLEKNSSTSAKTNATTAPTNYVAWYKDGTLTLNRYDGKEIKLQGAVGGDLTIKLIDDNTITSTSNEVGIQGISASGSITITADSGSNGKLTINVTNSTRPVFGINGYENSVTITGSADVTINATTTAADKESYGIKSKKAVSILDSASVSITCKTPNSTSRSDPCNGIFSEKNVTISTDGTIQIDVHEAGDEAYSYGIKSMDSLTLTKVGGMTVKWKKFSVYGVPLSPSSASFDSDAYVTNVDESNCIATYMPKGTTANISLSQTSTMDFGSAEENYAALAAKPVTITNNGTVGTGALTIALDSANKTDFTLSKTDITDIAASSTDTFTVQPKTGLSAGIYTATVKVSGTGAGVTEQRFDVKFTVTAPATPITEALVPVTDLTGKTYDESAQEPTFGGSLARDTDYTVSYAVKSGFTGTLNSDGKPVGAGTYVVTVAGKGSYTGSFTKDFKIDKADPSYTAPTAKTGLAYTGSALELITAGSVSKGGEMQYKQGSGSYGPDIPVATNAGDYIVYYQITANDNYNAVAETQVGSGAINIAQVEWGAPAEALTPVNPTTAGSSDGKITGTTNAMQYKKSTDSGWTDCPGDVTGLAAGTYYVRYKADINHTASDTNYKTVTLTDPGATLYGVTVTDGTASPSGDQAAGTEVTITANTKTGFNFKEWTGLADGIYKSGSTKTSNPATFTMPASAVNVAATYEAAALTGTVSITGTEKFGQTLTADTTGITNNTGTLIYKWYRGSDEIIGATGSTYTLVEDDIGKTITVKVSSNVQTGEITSSATWTIDRADGPAAPSVTPVACTNSSNNDGKITGVNTTMEYSSVSDFATKTACTGSEITGLVNGTYYVRVAETTTHKAGAAANVNVPAYTSGTLGGFASISGTAKYGEVLTAETASITGNTGTLTYKWYRGSDEISGATGNTYTLVEEDIGKTITVKITSSVESGTIVSPATAAVDKADGPAAPAAFTLTFTPNADGTTFTATIPTVAGGEYSFDGTNYSATNTKADCAANSSYTGYVRIAETSTHKASTATSSTQTSPKLTVATPTFMPNGVSGFTGTQSVTISCTTAGAKIYYTTDGTTPTASSLVYSTPLSLTSTTTVKAIAVNAGMNDSAIATATFTKYSGGGGGGGGSYTPSYTVSVDKTENGTITVSPKSASKGDAVTITVKPDKGYELDTLKVLDKNGDKVKLTEKNGKYIFTMPTGKVTVKGSFVEEAPVQIFKDVPVDAYYYEAVKWAAEKGITGGVGNGLFAPNQPCTRAQIVTFLWRAAGSPALKNMSSFTDVPADAFYAKAVAWAVENGITGGTGDGKFSPDATCTRAQSVTFLYRAAGSPKVSSSAEFGDVATNAYYADAVAWAAKNGITGGIGGGQFGSGNDCTRAQIVTFLYRNYQSK